MHKKAISLKELFNIAFIIVTFMFVAFILIGVSIYIVEEKLLKNQELRYQSYLLADELRQSSDDLTKYARTYVVTGDKKYLSIFNRILDIRNGEVERPLNYERIYWDLYVATGNKPREDNGIKKSLKELMFEAGFTQEEFDKLAKAEANSNGLVETELIAMRAKSGFIAPTDKNLLLDGENLDQFARRVMFDKNYHDAKGRIMKPIDEFFILLEERTSKEVNKYTLLQRSLLKLALFFILIMLTLISVIFWIIYNRIQKPLNEMPLAIENIAKGNYTKKLEIKVNDELGDIAHGFNEFIDISQEVIQKVKDGAEGIVNTSNRLNQMSVDLANKSMEQTTALEETTATMEEISALVSMNTEKTIEANQLTNQTVGDVNNISLMSKKLKLSMKKIKLSSKRINEVVGLIEGIAFQTKILSINAAVEAVKAGNTGSGFGVVSSEIKDLASKTSESAKYIRRILERNSLRIENGTNIVYKTIEDLEKIILAVEDIDKVISEITQSAEEQKKGVEDVDIAILEVSSATNSEIAESVSELSEELLETAKEFLTIVSYFRIDEDEVSEE